MNTSAAPRFGKGVRLHTSRDGQAMLLIPEGALVLNPSAAATLELIDGARTIAEIVHAITERFDVTQEQAQGDVGELIARLAERRLILI
jgi:pyrroloquinoline quinone biosynthesis protein D